jgi:chromosome segregation and condensation protein ScpB/DNA-binding XRE family transcriptional regulator
MGRTAVPEGAATELAEVARELRRRRELLGLSQVALSELSGVSRTIINRVEAGHRVPSVRTYARLRATLGLEAPPASLIPRRLPVGPDEDRVAALCAALLVTREVPLADLASALDISIPAVRENLDRAAERLAPVGFSLTDDGGRVRLWPLSCAEAAVRTVTDVEEVAAPSAEQLEILAITAYFGQATRALIERYRGEDSESLLDRLVRRGLLAKVRDDQALGAPNVYRVTAKALRAAGFATVEAMRAAVAEVVSAEERMRLLAHGDAGADSDAMLQQLVAS